VEKIAHSPFLYHLFICCGGDYKTFVNEISNQIETKIEEIYASVKHEIAKRKPEQGSQHATTKEFRQFVERMEKRKEKCEKKNGKAPNYCMFEFYKQIAKLEQRLMSNETNNKALPTDIDIIHRFGFVFDYFNDYAEAINDRRLKDLFRNIKYRKPLNNTQENIFNFMLNESFPNYVDERGGLLERMLSKPWKDLAFGNSKNNIFILKTLQNDKRYEQIEKLFNEFKKISSTDILSIRINLNKISNLLDDIYKPENYINYIDNLCEKKNNLTEYDSVVEDVTVLQLHSHILAFMRWLPMISQDEPNEILMESVDNVIDKIKLQVCKIIDSNDDLGECLARYPTDFHDTIFVQANCKNLRKLLIEALSHESNIYFQFEHFYGVNIYKILSERGDVQ